MSASRCPWCGKFRSSWAPNPRQSEWDMMQGGREYICIQCAETSTTESKEIEQ